MVDTVDMLDTLDTLNKLKIHFIDENRYNEFKNELPALSGEEKICSDMTNEIKSLIIENNHMKRIAYINSGLSTYVLIMLLFYRRELEFNIYFIKEQFMIFEKFYIECGSVIKACKKIIQEEFLLLFRKLTLFVFNTKAGGDDKKEIIFVFGNWISKNKNIFYKVDYYIGVIELELILGIFNDLKLKKYKLNCLSLEIKALIHIKDINYYDKVYKWALRYYEENFPNDIQKQTQILNCLSKDEFQKSYALAKKIDKLLPKYYNINECLKPEIYNEIYSIAEKNIPLLCLYYDEYLSTSIYNLPSFETSLMMMIYFFLKLFLEVDIKKGSKGGLMLENYFNKNRLLVCYFKLTQVIRVLSTFESLNRFIATELLQIAIKKGNFGFVSLFSRLDVLFTSEGLSENLTNKFIKKILNPPYRDVLIAFYNPKLDSEIAFEDVINNALSRVRIILLPKLVSGITLSNMIICLPDLPENDFSYGVMFYILIHELAYYLQRTSISFFRESCENESEKLINFFEDTRRFSSLNQNKLTITPVQPTKNLITKEGGEYIEYILFNGPNKRIYKSAGEYIFNTQETNLEKLKKKFIKKNKSGQESSEESYKIRQLENDDCDFFSISECGTKMRMMAYEDFLNQKSSNLS